MVCRRPYLGSIAAQTAQQTLSLRSQPLLGAQAISECSCRRAFICFSGGFLDCSLAATPIADTHASVMSGPSLDDSILSSPINAPVAPAFMSSLLTGSAGQLSLKDISTTLTAISFGIPRQGRYEKANKCL